jgi:hypothetical protein
VDSALKPDPTTVAKGIRITLLLGLDSRGNAESTSREQTLIVRKIHSKVETIR